MSTAAVIIIAIVVVVVLGAHRLRHRRSRAATCAVPGRSAARPRERDKRRRDRSAAVAPHRAPTSSGGRAAPRRHAPDARSRPTPAAGALVPPDPEAIGVSRRQFLNVLDDHADERRPRHVRRRRVRRLPVADGQRRLRRQGQRSARWTTSSPASATAVGSSTTPGQARGSRRTRPTALPKAEAVAYYAPVLVGMRAGHRSCCTRSARTSAAACRRASAASGSSARATARSTTRSARRRAVRRRAAWTTSPPRSRRRRRRRSTPARVVHRHADRHQHHRPGGRGSALHHGSRRALMR